MRGRSVKCRYVGENISPLVVSTRIYYELLGVESHWKREWNLSGSSGENTATWNRKSECVSLKLGVGIRLYTNKSFKLLERICFYDGGIQIHSSISRENIRSPIQGGEFSLYECKVARIQVTRLALCSFLVKNLTL